MWLSEVFIIIITFGVVGILIDLHINSKKARKDIDEIKGTLQEISNKIVPK
ncbi:MAG: hypothetical protein WCI77_06580 [Candidatus Omnitrophota bacterium]